jgi:membrane protease YdiL (CAAX protease family)
MQLELPVNHWLLPVLSVLAMASCATWLWILLRKIAGQPLIPHSPRRPVPWSVMATFLAVIMAMFALAGLASSAETGFEELTVEESVQQLSRSMLLIVSITSVALFLVASAYRANWHDLGLPDSFSQLFCDCALGVAGFLVALVPVYGVQAALVYGLDEPSQHPLITKILSDPDPTLLVVGFLTAVVVAPVCEEIAFRLLLQGWLEKWWCGQRDAESQESGSVEQEVQQDATDGPLSRSEDAVVPALRTPHSAFALLPIFSSSLVFAIAHIGHGPDPIAIFLLALILGYLYQRTHRIVPCIVTHLLFNAFSLLVLITLIFSQK